MPRFKGIGLRGMAMDWIAKGSVKLPSSSRRNPGFPFSGSWRRWASACMLSLLFLPRAAGDDWRFDVVVLKNGATFPGLLVKESPLQIEFKPIRRQPGSPTVVIWTVFHPSEIKSIQRLDASERRRLIERLKALDPMPPVVRYQRERPGELLHFDTKKLGRIEGVGHRITGRRSGAINRHHGIGWEALHVCIDDASRLAYTELLPDEKKENAIAFLGRALDWFSRHGVDVERVMTDNGSAYRSHAFRAACARAGLKHIRTRPYTPRTNGKAERFIQTSLREWAYARAYQSSAERGQAMHPWIANYNHTRPHSALGGNPPASKLNNVLGFNT